MFNNHQQKIYFDRKFDCVLINFNISCSAKMDQLNPQPPMGMQTRIPQMPPHMFAGGQQMMMPGSMRPPYQMMNPMMGNYPEQVEKRKEFSRGVYVTGFEKTLTPAMLEQHFKIKPINGLKLPMSKYNENKGFAFIYYGSQDDASYVKKKLDHTVILRSKIRVTRTVISENLSKMMFKLKTGGLSEEEVSDIEKRFFNEEALEKQVQKIIQTVFQESIEVNKIVIPTSKHDKRPLKYARVFFYVSSLKDAFNIVRQLNPDNLDKGDKNQYEIVLSYIATLLNENEVFRRNISAEIYEYTKKNQSNILHLKGIKHASNENKENLAFEVRNLVQDLNKQSIIIGSFVNIYERFGAWANITFSTYEETVAAYENLKNERTYFREAPVYASLRNVKDTRTVVISTVKTEVTEEKMQRFLKDLALASNKVDGDDPTKGRKYDFFSFNILSKKTFYLNNESEQVGITEEQKPDLSWRQMNTVPRRVVVHFMNEISEEQVKELVNEIKNIPGWEDIFFHQERKQPLRANHQKGHIKNDKYVKHTDLKSKKKPKVPRERPVKQRQDVPNTQRRTTGPTNPTNDYSQFNHFNKSGGNMARSGGGVPIKAKPTQGGSNVPSMGVGSSKSGMQQRMPVMGGGNMMGHSSMGHSSMGHSSMGQSSMGQSNPQMGNLPKGPYNVPMGQMQQSMGQMPQTMGQMPPTMGGQMLPTMGQMPQTMGQMPPTMGQIPPAMGGQGKMGFSQQQQQKKE